MTDAALKQTLGFETEVSRLLNLMIHSLYSNPEIFLRELVSNAADAADKLRFEALSRPDLLGDDAELGIWIDVDEAARKVIIRDNAIGMSRDEVVRNLGTIARSGTAEFMASLSGDQQKDSALIGQFGVGFYSAFVVADKVEVLSRRAGLSPQEGVRWESEGKGEFTVEPASLDARGTTITLHLRESAAEFANAYRLRNIIHKYAEHIGIPVWMVRQVLGEEPPATVEYEQVNKASALWTRPRTEISDGEYKEFYKHVAHDFSDPLDWSHNRVEGKLEYTSLLYLPGRAPLDINNREAPRGLKLYVQRVFIMDEAEQFLPLYLRFVKGVLDSGDLPLNVSREILQSDPSIETIRNTLVKRVLDMLAKMANTDPEKYITFWKAFGNVLKEGVIEDAANQPRIATLLRFSSSTQQEAGQTVSLADYVSRMKEGQTAIYYITAESLEAGRQSPHMEFFRKKDIEVLIMHDRIDEWMMSWLREFEGKSLVHIGKADLDLAGIGGAEEQAAAEKSAKEHAGLLERIQGVLKDRVASVRASSRLTESPSCLVVSSGDIGLATRQLLEAAGQQLPPSQPVLEVNLDHSLVKRLDKEEDGERFEALSQLLFDQAALTEGVQLQDPAAYVRRLNRLLESLL